MDAWGDMEEESFFDAPNEVGAKISTPLATNPFQDDGEPDFAGWLAAQAQKKPGLGKPLPKGLANLTTSNSSRPSATGKVATTGSVGGAGAKKAAVTAMKPKPIVAKKIDTAPKVADDDDGWGDGW